MKLDYQDTHAIYSDDAIMIVDTESDKNHTCPKCGLGYMEMTITDNNRYEVKCTLCDRRGNGPHWESVLEFSLRCANMTDEQKGYR